MGSSLNTESNHVTSSTARQLRRGAVACKRCRRLRSKCSHDGRPPCVSCAKSGSSPAAECVFPRRGEQDQDRGFRAKKHKVSEGSHVLCSASPSNQFSTSNLSQPTIATTRSQTFDGRTDGNSAIRITLPSNEIVEGFRVFVTSYFQLGFFPKTVVLERLAKGSECISTFLLLAVLAVSGRFTMPIVKRYNNGATATSHFLELASRLVQHEMYEPSLERIQAFFLLAIAEWGNGNKNRSFIHMGIAVRMAAILKLHREETYALTDSATSDEVVEMEMARRTFWMIQSQENLHSGYSTPMSFSPADVTTLLPSDEADFAFGTIPSQRAALQNTPPAIANPDLITSSKRSLFATLIQAHSLWGTVARRASMSSDPETALAANPWDETSEFAKLSGDLQAWESALPLKQRWSIWNLRGYKAESQDLAYLSTTMVLRLSNIVLRRIYLQDLIRASHRDFGSVSCSDHGLFWQTVSRELFANVIDLHEQIDAYFSLRSKDDGYPAILVFCVYVCGSLASYLWKYPKLCPSLSRSAKQILTKSLDVLSELQDAWPTAKRWTAGLQSISTPRPGLNLAPTASTKHDTLVQSKPTMTPKSVSDKNAISFDHTSDQWAFKDFAAGSEGDIQEASSSYKRTSIASPSQSAMGALEADFTEFLQNDLNYSFPHGWELLMDDT